MNNPFKSLGDLKKMRDQAMAIQKQLSQEKIELDEDGVHIVISGDQKILEFEIQGIKNDLIKDKLNKAIKQSQETAAKKLQEMSGGLQGLLGGE
ncbi:MAG TPA: YbaB/EbfC family nucleoid-associated protein [Patescibacteria group bacterium]|nr:YbaB/EbfC family nucleoid-associated protein [Patescibacteria group bacterium]